MLAIEPQAYADADASGFCARLIDLQLNPQRPMASAPSFARRLALIARAGTGDESVVPWQAALEGSRKIDRHWNVTYSSHGWHRYVGRFPPHLVRALLNHFSLSNHSTVLDPFAGSGTTLVEARLLGINSVGIEICPLGSLMSAVKSRLDLRPTELAAVRDQVLNRFWALQIGRKNIDLDIMPSFPNIDKWFTEDVRSDLCALLQSLVEVGDSPARDALLIALSACMRSIGNVDVDVVRAEYRLMPRTNVQIDRLLSHKVSRMIHDLESFQALDVPSATATVHLADARQTDKVVRAADFILTSPPYGIESISYLRTHMLSYRVLHHFLKSDPWSFGENVIGSEYLKKGLTRNVTDIESPTARRFFAQFGDERGAALKRVEQSAAYFRDMQTVISTWPKVLRKGIGGVMIIGNKKLLTRTIPTNVILGELLESSGFRVEPLFQQKLVCNNTNAQTPWSQRAISEEYVVAFYR